MLQARVIEEHKTNYIIAAGKTEYTATVRGNFFTDGLFPKVGDYVTYEVVANNKAVIESILPRTSTVVRKAVESEGEQVLVTNVDVIFIVMGLDNDFNVSRLERYLLLAAQSQVPAVVILNKCDGVADIDTYIEQTKAVTGNTPIHAVSAKTGDGMELLLSHVESTTTAVLLGSSGAGKSTITNWLLQKDTQAVKGVRIDDSRGRHTTTARQLFALPTGGFLIDTPGMRELAMLDSTAAAEDEVFAVIEDLASSCRFSNCDHDKSAGCAVQAAVQAGKIEARQLENYRKLQRERLFAESKQTKTDAFVYKQKKKKLYQNYSDAQETKRFNNKLD